MIRILNLFFFILVLAFFLSTFKHYISSKNIETKKFNRSNIDQIIDNKISNLPILNNDTDNVIEFNDGYTSEKKNEKPRSFWNLLK